MGGWSFSTSIAYSGEPSTEPAAAVRNSTRYELGRSTVSCPASAPVAVTFVVVPSGATRNTTVTSPFGIGSPKCALSQHAAS